VENVKKSVRTATSHWLPNPLNFRFLVVSGVFTNFLLQIKSISHAQ